MYRLGTRRFSPLVSVSSSILKSYFRCYGVQPIRAEESLLKVFKPNLNSSIFTRNEVGHLDSYLNYPIDSFPNPLFRMSKSELFQLSSEEFTHLIQIPYRSIQESDQFCIHIIDIINTYILKDANRISGIIKALRNNESIFDLIIETLRVYYEKDKIMTSVIEYMIDPSHGESRRLFFECISDITVIRNKDSNEKAEILLNYLRVLAMIDVVNYNPLLLKTDLYKKIIRIIPSSRYAELYLYFLNVNIQTYNLKDIEILKKRLIRGSNIEKYIARTGWLNAKWHDVERSNFNKDHKSKMVNFFSITDLKKFTEFAISNKDVVNSNLYLNLLVSKFEIKCSELAEKNFNNRVGDTTIDEDTHIVLDLILEHVMVFKGSKKCIGVLKYMLTNNLPIKLNTILIILKNLRIQGFYKEGLVLVNSMNLERLSQSERKLLVDEIINLIYLKYPDSPKILIGYLVSFFNGSEDENKVLRLLNELNVLGITYGNGQLGTISDFGLVQKANIDKLLSGFEITSNALNKLYETILNSIPKDLITPEFIYSLYEAYKTVSKGSTEKRAFPIFSDNKLDDGIVLILIKYLLKEDPKSNKMDLVLTKSNYEVSKLIFNDFNDNLKLHRSNRTVYLHDLLVYTSLTVHQDYTFASSVVRLNRSEKLPLSFNQIYPFILFHYHRKEFDLAKLWYDEMVKQGVKATSPPSKELFRIARELKWNVNGFTYRKFRIHSNYKKKEELQKMLDDPILFMEDSNLEEEVTEDLINPNSNEISFDDELASIMYKSNSSI